MTTKDMDAAKLERRRQQLREAQARYYREYANRPENKERLKKAHRDYRKRIQQDPMNQAMRYAIQDYLQEEGLTTYGLSKRLGATRSRGPALTGGRTRIHPEELKPIPELYERLLQIQEEYRHEE